MNVAARSGGPGEHDPGRRAWIPVLCVLLAVLAAAPAGWAETPASAERTAPRKLTIANKPWTGDFDQMLAWRVIRVYAPFSRSLYFNDKGRERGIAVELVRDWQRYLNIIDG